MTIYSQFQPSTKVGVLQARESSLAVCTFRDFICRLRLIRSCCGWVQHLQSVGGFRNLRRLTLEVGDIDDRAERDRFAQCVIVLSGLWQLQYCCFSGCVDCMAAIQYLPVTLQHLVLKPTDSEESCQHAKIPLSSFSRFTALQSLELYVYPDSKAEGFYELNTDFPALTHLYLHKRLPLKLLIGQCISQCLPQVQHIVACIGAGGAHRLMTMPTLLCIGLTLLPVYVQTVLKVEEKSHLIKVVIIGPPGGNCNILLKVEKTGTRIDVCNVAVRILNNNDYCTAMAPELIV